MINENADLPDDVFAKLPGSSAVLNHAVCVDGVRWERELTARGLPLAQGKLAGQGRTSVTRKEVFDLGDQTPTIAKAFQLFYYSLAWGLGTRAQRLHQRLDGMAAQQEIAGERLVSAWTSVQDGAPLRDAYRALTTDRGAGRIPWFGLGRPSQPNFSTSPKAARSTQSTSSWIRLSQRISAWMRGHRRQRQVGGQKHTNGTAISLDVGPIKQVRG